MHVLNAGASSDYYDSLVDEREDSAVSAIHGAWLEHSSDLGRLEHLEPLSPLDMLVLYQGAAATFRDWIPGSSPSEELVPGGRVINREKAEQRLQSVTDEELAKLATRFANRIIALSAAAAGEQDLDYCTDLFLHCIQDKRVIEGIMSGNISRHGKELSNPDLW